MTENQTEEMIRRNCAELPPKTKYISLHIIFVHLSIYIKWHSTVLIYLVCSNYSYSEIFFICLSCFIESQKNSNNQLFLIILFMFWNICSFLLNERKAVIWTINYSWSYYSCSEIFGHLYWMKEKQKESIIPDHIIHVLKYLLVCWRSYHIIFLESIKKAITASPMKSVGTPTSTQMVTSSFSTLPSLSPSSLSNTCKLFISWIICLTR